MIWTILFWYCVVSYVLYGFWCWSNHIALSWSKDSPKWYVENRWREFGWTFIFWLFSPLCFLLVLLVLLGLLSVPII